MPIAIIHQSYGRFGGAERVALAHYEQLRKMNVDATLFWSGEIYPGWRARLNGYEIRTIPSTLPSPRRLAIMTRFLRELSRYDSIIIHHHVDPLLSFYIARNLGGEDDLVFRIDVRACLGKMDYRRGLQVNQPNCKGD